MIVAKPVDVIFIAGIGRSGTTVLSRLLGSLDGIENLGEFASFWSVPGLRNLPCGCGEEVMTCPRWSGWAGAEILADYRHLIRNSSVFDPSARTAAARGSLGAELADRYARAASESGARVLVDASKRPALALALAASPEIDVRLAHMVRDPRAVAASRMRQKGYLERIPPWKLGPRWTAVNLASEKAGRRAPPRALIRHEDLVENPRETIEALLRQLGFPAFDLKGLDSKTVQVGVQHSLAGNPDKLGSATVSLEQRQSPPLSRWDTRVIEVTTLPVRRRYDY